MHFTEVPYDDHHYDAAECWWWLGRWTVTTTISAISDNCDQWPLATNCQSHKRNDITNDFFNHMKIVHWHSHSHRNRFISFPPINYQINKTFPIKCHGLAWRIEVSELSIQLPLNILCNNNRLYVCVCVHNFPLLYWPSFWMQRLITQC